MNKNKIIKNTLVGGMDMDSSPSAISKDKVTFRMNGEPSTDRFTKTWDANIRGNEEYSDLPKDIVSSVVIDERDWIIYISKDNGNDSIGYVDLKTKKYLEIMNAQEFGCSWNFIDCEWLSLDYDYISGCNELKLYFSSNWIYYNVNIDEMLDPVRKKALKEILKPKEEGVCGETDCTYFKSFNCTCGVRTVTHKSEKGGYNLQAGVLQFAVQLIDANGAKTNVFHASEPINIGSENNIPGEISSEYVHVSLDNLSCKYHIARIIVIKTIGGMTSAEIVADKQYVNGKTSFDYYGTTGDEVPISLNEVMVQGKTLIEGQDLFIHNDKTWYYKLKPHKNPDLQAKVIEQTKVNLGVWQQSYEDVIKFGSKTLMRGESYLFAISYNVCGKGSTPSYVLSPTGGTDDSVTITNRYADELDVELTAQGVLRTRGGAAGTSGCMSGNCGGIELRGQGEKGGEDGENTFNGRIKEAVESIKTSFEDICGTLDCESDCCTEEGEKCCNSNCDTCECDYRHKGANECKDSLPGVEEAEITMTQWVAGLCEDDTNADLSASSLKEASLNLINNGVDNKEYVAYKAAQLSSSGGEISEKVQPQAGIPSGDTGVDAEGNPILNNNAIKIASKSFKIQRSAELYPDTKNCEGEYLYGKYAKKQIQLFKVPDASEIPLIKTFQRGVVNRWQPENTEWSKTYVNLIGLDITNIYIPTTEELGGKLCEDNPFTITMIPRDWANSTIVAKGLSIGTFEGVTNGRRYAFPKHGVNSAEKIDRFINNKNSRKGEKGEQNRFIFHSADTAVYHMGLAVSHVKPELILNGGGYRYGLYEWGTPPENALYGSRVDMGGCRSASNLNISYPYSSSVPDEGVEVQGITYAKGNRIITPPKGIDLPLMNRMRESSVYFQANDLQDLEDKSFVGDVLEHEAVLENNKALYISLRRKIPAQYGSLVNQVYVSTGLEAHKNSGNSISGICGDTYIGYNTVKRTSYISDKVGNEFNIPAMVDIKKKKRTVCDPPEDWVEQTMGFHYSSKLPLSGDPADAKNWAGLHTIDDEKSFSFNEAKNDSLFPRSEYYYPKTLTHLVHYWGESRVCPWLLQTGAGEQKYTKKVYYPKLKDLDLDSSIYGREWDECWLNSFRNEKKQPSRALLLKRSLIKWLINYLLPAMDLAFTAMLDTPVDVAAYGAIQPLLIGGWLFLKNNLLDNRKLDEMLGIPTCHTDSDGAQGDHNIKGWTDNYVEYNTDYSSPNKINIYRGMPDPYYTCNCNDIINGQTSDEIKYSDTRTLGSMLDSYLNVSPLNSIIVPSKYGKIQKLFYEGGKFFVHTDKQLLLLQEGNLSIPTVSGKSLVLGGGGLLDIPEGMFKTVPEGFVGLQDPNSSFTTPFGQVFVDAKARAIYLMQGGRPNRISDNGLSRFFWDKLPFGDCGDCRDEKKGLDYLFGVDYENNRLYFTKKECKCSYTVMYLLDKKEWYGFVSFIPEFYTWTRDKMFTVKDNKLWQHNKGKHQTFYNEYSPYTIEVSSYDGENPIEYKSTIVESTAKENGLYDRNKFFTDIAMYSMTQSSGTRKLELNDKLNDLDYQSTELLNIRVDNDGRKFKINGISNKADFNDIITTESCPYYDIANVDSNDNLKQFYDDYLITRLTLNNKEEDIELITKSVSLLVENRNDG